jgi:hypothetical protein
MPSINISVRLFFSITIRSTFVALCAGSLEIPPIDKQAITRMLGSQTIFVGFREGEVIGGLGAGRLACLQNYELPISQPVRKTSRPPTIT